MGVWPWPALELVKKRTEGALPLSFSVFLLLPLYPTILRKLSLLSLFSQLKRFSWVSPHWFSPQTLTPTVSHNRSCSPARVLGTEEEAQANPDCLPQGPGLAEEALYLVSRC